MLTGEWGNGSPYANPSAAPIVLLSSGVLRSPVSLDIPQHDFANAGCMIFEGCQLFGFRTTVGTFREAWAICLHDH